MMIGFSKSCFDLISLDDNIVSDSNDDTPLVLMKNVELKKSHYTGEQKN